MSDSPPPPRRGKRGPERIGDREQRSLGIERVVLRAIEAAARREGLAPAMVVTRLCAEGLGLDVPDYCLPKNTSQEALPLAEAS